MLELLGLDAIAEAVYREMLTDPEGGVTELRDRLALPEATVRAALDRLADLTLLRASREQPGTLRPVSPERGLDLLLRRQEEKLARRQQELAASKAAVARALAGYATLRADTPTGGHERLVGLDAIQDKLEELAARLTAEVLAVTPGGAQSAASLAASRPLDEDALLRGVRLRTIYQDSVHDDPETLGYARWMVGLGGEVRTAPVLPPRMLVFDRSTAVVPIDPENTRAGALCTREPGIVASLIALFEQTWETAVPIADDRAAGEETGLSAGERELLRLLSTGLTDDAAAKRLGVSVRTVRRQMAALMERLEAASRFEAGLKTARRGWL
ncbi:DNA-binding CsgD family transcriptional regulator/sugar-specific transcriptional regulator TrmB [Kitasatospora sp. MAA19]|uniref:helix-turn-helix transcriptional regulator n=1 Tax=Kitasatospora sp. MAA19 TaxID=3035090 RepID=UPI002476B455|nr:LuxR C-terminal-related transcriptional regulator [Kitasatospora sp. MAA19]MDH6707976.1 DNA-binding CsgD family transcriptional regulator/sugar-specific transcriptional regulator TrmB [Kitasatospora sp. MAA19]